MAQFEQTGVTLVAEGLTQYLDAIRQAREATVGMGSAGQEAAPGLDNLFSKMVGAVSIGNLLSGAFTQVTNAVVDFGQKAVQAASTLQDTQLNIQTLTAAEIKNAGGAATMTDAMAKALPVAQSVMSQLKTISLASPFEYHQILSVYQMNKAFGQSTDMSLELTKAITNLGAANKSIPGIMERVSYNFSQMAMVGKITSRDIRDLAMAGVNLSQVFQQSIGKSVDEVNKDLESGKMTFEDVSKAFVGYVNQNFSSAAEQASRTFSGLVSSFNDLQFFASTDVVGPALDTVTAKLQTLFNTAMNFIQAGGLQPIGAGLDLLVSGLMNLGDQAVNAGMALYNQFGGQVEATANAAVAWGSNIIVQFASGMMDGIASTLSGVMDYLSSILSYFMAPGSPPRFLPEVDQWGAGTIQAYLQGFSEADFGVLSALSGPINSALSQLVNADALGKDYSKYLGKNLERMIAGVMSGTINQADAVETVRASLGDYGGAIADLTNKQINYAKATEQVKADEDALKKSREQLDAANTAMIDAMDAFNQASQEGADPAVLAAKRKEFEQAKASRDLALTSSKEAEKKLKDDSKNIDSLKEQVDLQKQLVSALMDLTKQEKEEDKVAKEKKKGGAGAKTAADAMKGKMPDLSKFQAEAASKIAGIETMIKEKLGLAFQPLVDAWNNAKGKLEKSWETFSGNLMKFLQPIIDAAKGPLEDVRKVLEDIALKIFTPEFVKNLGEAAGAALLFVGAWKGGVALFTGIRAGLVLLGGVFGGITLGVGALIVALVLLTAVIMTFGGDAWKSILMLGTIIKFFVGKAWQSITDFFSNLVSTWKTNWALAGQIITTFFTGLITQWQNNWNALVLILSTVWNQIWGTITTIWTNIVNYIPTQINLLKNAIIGRMNELDPDWRASWTQIQLALAERWDAMKAGVAAAMLGMWTSITGKMAEIGAAISSKWDEIKAGVATAMLGMLNLILPKMDEIGGAIGGGWEKIRGNIAEKLTAIKNHIDEQNAAWVEIFTRIITNVLNVISEQMAAMKARVKSFMDAGKEAINTAITEFKALGKAVIEGFLQGIVDSKNLVIDALAKLALEALNAAKKALGIASPSTEAEQGIGIPLIMGIVQGIMGSINTVIDTLKMGLSTILGGLGTFIGTALAPVITTVATTVSGAMLPAFTLIGNYLSLNFQPILLNLGMFITTVFLPALLLLNQFIVETMAPRFMEFYTFLSGLFYPAWSLIGTYLGGDFMNTLVNLHTYIVKWLWAALTDLAKWLTTVMAQAAGVAAGAVSAFQGALDAAAGSAQALIGVIADLAAAMESLKIPEALTPGSPTPFELGLIGIMGAMKTLTNQVVPALASELNTLQMPSMGQAGNTGSADASMARMQLARTMASAGQSESRSYNLTLQSNVTADTVKQGFDYFLAVAP